MKSVAVFFEEPPNNDVHVSNILVGLEPSLRMGRWSIYVLAGICPGTYILERNTKRMFSAGYT